MALAAAVLLCSVSAADGRARTLNDEGMRFYDAGDHAAAKDAFARAVELDPDYALAHYNLACVLALLRAGGSVCEHQAYASTILEHLRRAVQLDPRRRARLQQDKDLASIHDTFGYQVLAGRRLDRPADLRAVLQTVSWFGPSPGAYGPMAGIQFSATGSYTSWTRGFDEAGEIQTTAGSGRWELQGTKLRLWHKDSKGEEVLYTGRLSSDGTLDLGALGRFTDDRDECSA